MSSPARFRSTEIRRGMEVYTADGTWLGTILRIKAEPAEDGRPVLRPAVRQSSEIDGERLGPMPTQQLGNNGPITQSARNAYGIDRTHGTPYQDASILIGKYMGLLGLRTVTLDEIQTVALEKIVLRPGVH